MLKKKQNWKNLGLIFSPEQGPKWMKSHAQVPTPLVLDSVVRVYFATRPEPNLSITSFVDLDINDPTRIVYIHQEPILKLGKPGTFDEHGIMPSCALKVDGKIYLYYSGWQRGTTVPYSNSTGLAISDDDGLSFKKCSEGPILSKNIYDPYSATSPYVVYDKNIWHMWYCSGIKWIKINNKYEHTYNIKYAYSNDGINWQCTGYNSIKQKYDQEAITRPWIEIENNFWRMWYCYRGSKDFRDGNESYKIGYAQHIKNIGWNRCDEYIEISKNRDCYDSRMKAYPAVFKIHETYMLYNGDKFGEKGFAGLKLGKDIQ